MVTVEPSRGSLPHTLQATITRSEPEHVFAKLLVAKDF